MNPIRPIHLDKTNKLRDFMSLSSSPTSMEEVFLLYTNFVIYNNLLDMNEYLGKVELLELF